MNWKKLSLLAAWGGVALIWLGLAGLYVSGPSQKVWAIAVTVTAVATELAFWATAGLLGLTVWESRARVFRVLGAPFRRSDFGRR
ncbi:hypothetical protein [Parvularcula oceani]|uniref:hypothetical protein n=1 Tax=Parvularcula oceani TaxID=1247963 RepID=UPI0004E1103B|nr:hypothetical protein [Parvularcula oceani]